MTPVSDDIAHWRETGCLELRDVVEPDARRRLIATTERLPKRPIVARAHLETRCCPGL